MSAVVRCVPMFVAADADTALYKPAINRTSKHLALQDIATRSRVIEDERQAKIARIAEGIEAERREHETFAPRINVVSRTIAAERTPLAARHYDANVMADKTHSNTSVGSAGSPQPRAPAADHQPSINAASKHMSDEKRAALEQHHKVRVEVRALWQRHADGPTMSPAAVRRVLLDIGLNGNDDLTAAKFLAALACTDAAAYVEYARFAKVFEAVLRNATQTRDATRQRNQRHEVRPQPAKHEPARSVPASQAQLAKPAAPAARASSSQPRDHGVQPMARSTARSGHPVPLPSAAIQRPPSTARRAPSTGVARASKAAAPRPSSSTSQRAVETKPRRAPKVEFVSRDEAELRACTFKPDTRHIHAPQGADHSRSGSASKAAAGAAIDAAHTAPDAPGFRDAIERLAKARRQHKPSFNDMLRSGEDGTQHAKPRGGKTVPKPFDLQLAKRPCDRTHPFLFVDVDMPNGRRGRVDVHHGDTPAALAASFSMTYGLDAACTEELEQLLKQRIDEHLRNGGSTTTPAPRPSASDPAARRAPVTVDIEPPRATSQSQTRGPTSSYASPERAHTATPPAATTHEVSAPPKGAARSTVVAKSRDAHHALEGRDAHPQQPAAYHQRDVPVTIAVPRSWPAPAANDSTAEFEAIEMQADEAPQRDVPRDRSLPQHAPKQTATAADMDFGAVDDFEPADGDFDDSFSGNAGTDANAYYYSTWASPGQDNDEFAVAAREPSGARATSAGRSAATLWV